MKRVASLYLPEWSIDLLRRAERPHAPPPERVDVDLLSPKHAGDAARDGTACDGPRNTGWRPGAKWARAQDVRAQIDRDIAALPAHQRPPMRALGRRSEAADHPYKRLPGDDGGKAVGWPEPGRGVEASRHAGRDPASIESRERIALVSRHDGPRIGSGATGAGNGRGTPPVVSTGQPSTDPSRTVLLRTQEHGAGMGDMPSSRDTVGDPAVAASSRGHAARWMPEQVWHDGGGISRAAAVDSRHPVVSPAGVSTVRAPCPPCPDTNKAVAPPAPSPRTGSGVHRAASPHMDGGRTRVPEPAPSESNVVAPFGSGGAVARWRVGATTLPLSDAADTAGKIPATAHAPARPALRNRPPPAGKSPHTPDAPLVTVQKTGSRVEVAAACPAARALGAAPGMTLTQLRAAVPGIAVRDADAAGDRAALGRLALTLARRWTPVVAVSDADGLFLDLTGVAHLHGGEARMMRRLVRGLARMGIAARVGVADTAGAAWALARHGAETVAILPPGDAMPALAAFPVAALRIGDHALDLLRRLGIDTVGALAALPRAPLARRFGRAVPLRLDQASGRVAEPLTPVVPSEPIAVAQRFTEPLLTAEPIAHWLGQLVVRLAAALATAGVGARAVALVATRVDNARQTVRIGLARPTRAPDHLLRLLVRRIETLDPGFGIETLALHVLRADPLGAGAFASDLADGDVPDLSLLVDAIANRIGAARLWRTQPLESDVPERAVTHAAPLDPPAAAATRLKRDDVRRLDARVTDHAWHPRWPRPVRLLHRPERVDHVIAELPDYPPLRFTWRGVTHRIVRGDGPERIAGEWWRRPAEACAVRDYFAVEDDAGERFWLFRRGDGLRVETGDLTWYMHGTFA